MLYRGVIVPGERVAHDKVWGFGVSFSGSTNASWSLWYGSCCIHLVIGSSASNVSVVCIFQNSVGASTRHVFIMGFRHRVMRKVCLEIIVFLFCLSSTCMETFVVRLVCFASPLFARSRSGRVELGRIRYSDPVLVFSESDESSLSREIGASSLAISFGIAIVWYHVL